MDYTVLATEISTDPLVRGYSGMTDAQIAEDINTVYRTCRRDYIFGWEGFNATDDVEYGALTDAQKSSWDALCAIEQIDVTSGVAKSREAELFGPGTTTRSNLLALRDPPCSRGEELGLGFVLTSDVTFAKTGNY